LILVGHWDAGVTVESRVVQESGEALVPPVGVWVRGSAVMRRTTLVRGARLRHPACSRAYRDRRAREPLSPKTSCAA
jgi:hypothetical protein